MTINEMYRKKAEFENQLKQLKGNSAIIKRARAIVKGNIEKVDMMIFKAAAPETFENHKNAIKNYIENTHML